MEPWNALLDSRHEVKEGLSSIDFGGLDLFALEIGCFPLLYPFVD